MSKFMRLSIVGVIIIMMLGVTGCMNDTNIENEKSTISSFETLEQKKTVDTIKTEVLEALEQKYQKKFVIDAYSAPSLLDKSYTFLVVEEGLDYEGYGFHAYYSGDTGLADGYFEIFVREQIGKVVIDACQKAGIKVFVQTSLTVFSESLNSASSLEDAVRIHTPFRVYVNVFGTKDTDYAAQDIMDALLKEGLTGVLVCYQVSEELLDSLNYSTFESVMGSIAMEEILVEKKEEFDF